MQKIADGGSQLPLFHIVGFTGHRQVESPELIAKAIDSALQFLQQTPGEWVALASVAEGCDQLFVRQALRRGLAWHAILPMPATEFSRDFTPEKWQEVTALLSNAEYQQVSNEHGEVPREDAYLDCGLETVSGSDLLIAVWDGEPARGKGGTADIVEYARSIGRPILLIDATTGERRVENWTKLDVNNIALTGLNSLPEARTWGDNPFKAPDAVFAFQQKCDFEATRSAPGVRRMTVSTVLLHVFATFIAAATLAYSLHLATLAWMKFLCLAIGVGAAFVLHRKLHSERSWVKCRLAAEFCRSALATWGLPRATSLLQDLDMPVVHHLSRSLRILHTRASATNAVSIEDFQRIYREQRIGDQLEYYRRQEQRALPQLRRLRSVFWIATTLAMACVAAYAVTLSMDVHAPAWLQTTVFSFLPVSLPVAAAATISIISINDLRRRVARYRDMQGVLESSRAQISYCRTWNSLERVVLRTERALLQEVIEWHSLASFSESH
jgi:SMODS and SLOG-associating 2TM effector domain 1